MEHSGLFESLGTEVFGTAVAKFSPPANVSIHVKENNCTNHVCVVSHTIPCLLMVTGLGYVLQECVFFIYLKALLINEILLTMQ